ncbi:unnamed protein product, partial [Amoebophrya sp. A25]|eukprot:GSA25T00012986001.1
MVVPRASASSSALPALRGRCTRRSPRRLPPSSCG